MSSWHQASACCVYCNTIMLPWCDVVRWCKGTRPMGTIILGDSAAAHFHIPPSWVRARGWNLDNLLHAVRAARP